jgi:hypothetical protein
MQSRRKSPDDVDRNFLFFCQINDKESVVKNRMNVVRQVIFKVDDKEVYDDERTDA